MIKRVEFYRNNKNVVDEDVTLSNYKDFNDITDVEVWISYDESKDVVYDFTDENLIIGHLIDALPEARIVGRVDSSRDLCEELYVDLRQAKAFLGVTDSLKQLSKCTRLKVCCVIEKDGRIISTGLNGTPAGFKNCSEVFSPIERLKKDYSTKHHEFSEAYEVHAEMNAVLELGKNSSIDSYKDLTLYCSTCPCPGCAKMIAQAGIKYVFYHNEYDRLPEGAKHLKEFGIYVFKC